MTDPHTPKGAAPRPAQPEIAALPENAVARLRLVIARLNRQMAQASSGQDLTFAQLSALARVEQHGPLRLGELAARERVAVPSMIRTIAPLTADGLIAKYPDPQDGRSQLLELTAAGVEAITRIRRERSELLAHRSRRLSPQQCQDLEAAIPVLELLLDDSEPPAPDSRAPGSTAAPGD